MKFSESLQIWVGLLVVLWASGKLPVTYVVTGKLPVTYPR